MSESQVTMTYTAYLANMRKAKKEERERIIALLESNLFTDKGLGNIRVSDLISLIKGEKK